MTALMRLFRRPLYSRHTRNDTFTLYPKKSYASLLIIRHWIPGQTGMTTLVRQCRIEQIRPTLRQPGAGDDTENPVNPKYPVHPY